MKLKQLNMYQRLRDFRVPSAVLDEIFASPEDLKILSQTWKDLKKTGLAEDEIAEAVSGQIFKDLNIDPAQDPVEKNMT